MNKEQLKNRDYILLVDKSGSMGTKDAPGGKSRWAYAEETTVALANKMTEYDPDGISVIPFNTGFKQYDGIKDTGLVTKLFAEHEPGASTDTAKALKHVLDNYFAAGADARHITVVVVTDGVPDSQEELEKVIVEATKKMTADEQIGISFIQIGNDPQASAFLKTLDDGLTAKGAKFDIVDTKTTEEVGNMTISEVLIAALED